MKKIKPELTATKLTCEQLDCIVIHALAGDIPCYYLGMTPEEQAGLRGCQISPIMPSLHDLEDWCKRHKEKIMAVGSDDSIPDFSSLI
jgi:hypothetical protein